MEYCSHKWIENVRKGDLKVAEKFKEPFCQRKRETQFNWYKNGLFLKNNRLL